MKIKEIIVFYLLCVQLYSTEILPTDRQYAWGGNTGIPGGIPSVTTIFTTLSATGVNDDAQIQSALNSCPSNQVVKLNAGTFVLDDRLDFSTVDNGVVLRGSGSNSTTLRFDDSATACILMRSEFSDSLATGVTLASTATKGATTVSLSSVPSWVKTNHLYVIDQVDDSSFVTAGTTAIWETGNDYRYGQITTAYGHRGMSQLVKVTAINGTTITLEMPLVYGFSTAQTAMFWKSTYDPATTGPRRLCGIENLKIVGNFTDSSCHTIYMENADNCWVKGVTSDTVPGLCHIQTLYAYRCEIRDSSFYNAKLFGAGQGYGVGLYNGTTGFLVENNMFRRLHLAVSFNYGATANVVGYNAILEGQDDGSNKSIVSVSGHGSHQHMNLVEGNFGANQFNFDVVHGSGSHNVIFRNRIMGTNNINDGESCINLEYYNRRYSVIGNILGSSEHTIYEIQAPTTCSSTGTKTIFKIGHRNSYGCSTGCVGGGNCYDIASVNDALIDVNFDTVNDGIVLDTHTTSDLVTSYYRTSKPSWFGNRNWPPYSPSNGDTASDLELIPAGYYFVNNSEPPADSGGSQTSSGKGNMILKGTQTIK